MLDYSRAGWMPYWSEDSSAICHTISHTIFLVTTQESFLYLCLIILIIANIYNPNNFYYTETTVIRKYISIEISLLI